MDAEVAVKRISREDPGERFCRAARSLPLEMHHVWASRYKENDHKSRTRYAYLIADIIINDNIIYFHYFIMYSNGGTSEHGC